MKTGAAYIRVSTEEQAEFSPDSQIRKIREYALVHEIALPGENIFLDEGLSGRNAEKRPAFMKMIALAKGRPRPFDVILVWKFSRFARNRQDSILYKSMLRKECGVDVLSVTEQLTEDPTAILVEALLEAMDEYYSINLAQEVRRGMNEKFIRGGVVSVPPFGYQMGKERDGAGGGVFEPDARAAPFVRMIYLDFLEGRSLRSIAGKLNGLGVRTARGNPFESRSVEYILTNPVYIGKQRRRLEGTGKETPSGHSGERAVVDGHHRPLVTQETFDAVQQRLKDRKTGRAPYTSPCGETCLLKGLVRCSCCGATLTQTRKGRALQCHRYAKGRCPESHYITADKLNGAVLDQLGKDLILLADGISETIQIRAGCADGGKLSEKAARLLLERERRRLERIKEAYQEGADSLEEYRAAKTAALDKIRRLEKEMGAVSQETCAHCRKLGQRELMSALRSPDIGDELKNRMLHCLIAEIVFDSGKGTIRMVYRR